MRRSNCESSTEHRSNRQRPRPLQPHRPLLPVALPAVEAVQSTRSTAAVVAVAVVLALLLPPLPAVPSQRSAACRLRTLQPSLPQRADCCSLLCRHEPSARPALTPLLLIGYDRPSSPL